MVPYVITAIITFVITAVAIWFISAEYHKRVANTKIGNAEEKARGIIDEAVKTAENKKRESMLEIKEETIRSKNELDKEIKEKFKQEDAIISIVSLLGEMLKIFGTKDKED